MNINKIVSEIENAGPGVYEQTSDRREAIKSFGKKVAIAAIPIALSSLFTKSYAQTTLVSVIDILNYELSMEYLQYNLYKTANSMTGFIPTAADKAAFQTIEGHEQLHIAYLQQLVSAQGGVPLAEPDFDFTTANPNNTFGNVFSDYSIFLEIAQAFEDMGVRAYKGQLVPLRVQANVFTAIMRIQATEARHAAHIRSIRNLTPWIDSNISGIINNGTNNGNFEQPAYNGEDLVSQLDINIVNINGSGVSEDAASEAFDEPIAQSIVVPLINNFTLPG